MKDASTENLLDTLKGLHKMADSGSINATAALMLTGSLFLALSKTDPGIRPVVVKLLEEVRDSGRADEHGKAAARRAMEVIGEQPQ